MRIRISLRCLVDIQVDLLNRWAGNCIWLQSPEEVWVQAEDQENSFVPIMHEVLARCLCLFPISTRDKRPLSGINQANLLSYSFGSQKFEMDFTGLKSRDQQAYVSVYTRSKRICFLAFFIFQRSPAFGLWSPPQLPKLAAQHLQISI